MMTMSKAMKLPVSMRWRRWIIVMLLPWIAGCSGLRLSYNQGPTLAYWWLDGYADFSPEQAPRVKNALTDWFTWHRATQLADYAQALAAVRAQAVNPVTAAQVCHEIEAWQQRFQRAFDQAVPALTTQLRTMTVAQFEHLEKRQAAKHAERVADYLQASPDERQKAAFQRALDRAETLYGTLDEAQRKALAEAQSASPFNAELWLAELQLRNAEVVRSLRQWHTERAHAATVQAGLRRLAAETSHSPRAAYRAQARRVSQANCALMAQVHNGTTAAQRQHAIDKLQDWEDDLRALTAPR
jgi:hypothetical protein